VNLIPLSKRGSIFFKSGLFLAIRAYVHATTKSNYHQPKSLIDGRPWLLVIHIGGEHLRTGDAIAEEEVGTLEMYSLDMGSEVLWFDLAKRL
jgi:hypothetical protein